MCVWIYFWTQIHLHIHIHTYIYIHIYIYMYMSIYIHTHVNANKKTHMRCDGYIGDNSSIFSHHVRIFYDVHMYTHNSRLNPIDQVAEQNPAFELWLHVRRADSDTQEFPHPSTCYFLFAARVVALVGARRERAFCCVSMYEALVQCLWCVFWCM